MQDYRRHHEVRGDGDHVCQRCDHRAGHQCRVDADLLGDERQHTADALCCDDDHDHGRAYGERDTDRLVLEYIDAQEIHGTERHTDDKADPQFLPEDAERVIRIEVTDGNTANDQSC